MKFFIANRAGAFFGVACQDSDWHEAFRSMREAADLAPRDFEEVSEQVYNDTVMDLRFEDGEVQQ